MIRGVAGCHVLRVIDPYDVRMDPLWCSATSYEFRFNYVEGIGCKMMKAAKPLSCHSFSKASDLLWRSILDHLVRPAKGIEGDLVGCNTVEGSDLVRVAPLGYHVAGFGYYCVIDTDLLCSSISSMYVVYCRLHHTNRFNHVISISSLIVRPISLASYIIRESIPSSQSRHFW